MSTRSRFEDLVAILGWVTLFKKWQSTHALESCARPASDFKDADSNTRECCICFEKKAPPRDPCGHCGSALPVCEKCLHSWSWAAGSVKTCVVCRSDYRRPPADRRPLGLNLQEMSPTTCIFMIVGYIFVHYSWLIVCCRIATSPPSVF